MASHAGPDMPDTRRDSASSSSSSGDTVRSADSVTGIGPASSSVTDARGAERSADLPHSATPQYASTTFTDAATQTLDTTDSDVIADRLDSAQIAHENTALTNLIRL